MVDVDPTKWKTEELEIIYQGLQDIAITLGDPSAVVDAVGGDLEIKRRHFSFWNWSTGDNPAAEYTARSNTITFFDPAFENNDIDTELTTIHEYGHAISYNLENFRKDFRNQFWTDCGDNCPWGFPASTSTYIYDYDEDIAFTFAAYVWMENGYMFPADFCPADPTKRLSVPFNRPDESRLQFIKKWKAMLTQ